MSQISLKAGLFTQVLANDLVKDGVTIAQAGDTIVILPQTSPKAVIFEDSSTLHDKWGTASGAIANKSFLIFLLVFG